MTTMSKFSKIAEYLAEQYVTAQDRKTAAFGRQKAKDEQWIDAAVDKILDTTASGAKGIANAASTVGTVATIPGRAAYGATGSAMNALAPDVNQPPGANWLAGLGTGTAAAGTQSLLRRFGLGNLAHVQRDAKGMADLSENVEKLRKGGFGQQADALLKQVARTMKRRSRLGSLARSGKTFGLSTLIGAYALPSLVNYFRNPGQPQTSATK
jgi:hypothetical protein